MLPKFSLTITAFSVQLLLATAALQAAEQQVQLQDIERIAVQGDFRQTNLQKLPGSVVLLSEQELQRQSAQHLDDLLQQIGNLNFAAGASRGRYLQVRGVGERSEFVDTINPSVGLLLDGIDYSSLGLPSLFDLQQLEVFRGPEATRFGANAMAGMLNVITNQPSYSPETRLSATLANYHSHQLSFSHSDKINDQLAYRFVADQQQSDGFIRNDFLQRKDSNNIDENHLRGKLNWLATEDLTLDLVLNWHDIDNGYDAFSLDRNRVTLSDEPGADQQDIKAGAIKAHYRGWGSFDSYTQLSVLNANSDYSFDEDWSFQAIHKDAYATTDQYVRDRHNLSLDQRLQAKDNRWVAGVYASSQQTDLIRNYGDSFANTLTVFHSELTREHLAFYAEYQQPLHSALTLTSGLRAERYQDEYLDSNQIAQQGDDWMWGGKLSLNYQVSPQAIVYLLGSRGYKAGGVNGEALAKALDPAYADIAAKLKQQPTFAPEVLWNAEFGVKAATADQTLVSRVASFYMWRDDMQVNSWINRGTKFIGYLANAGSGRNYGIEMENRLQLLPELALEVNASLLHSEIRHFRTDKGVDQTGREQAHAPDFQYSVGLDYALTSALSLQVGLQHKDGFYYSDSHDSQAAAMTLLNLRVNYSWQQLTLALWSRNALDENYGVRGFFFGNDPRDGYQDHVYEQFGEPRRIGVTASYQF